MKKAILVTAIGSFSAGAVIDTCRREGYRVVGCDIYPAEWVVNSMEVDAFYQAPYATDWQAYQTFLTEVCRKEQVDFLIPLTDVEVDALQDWPNVSAELQAVICMSGHGTIALCRNKEKMERFLSARGICQTIPGQRLSEIIGTEWDSRFAGLTYPLVLKPWDGRSSQGLRIIKSPKEMMLAVELCKHQTERYMVQPMIAGNVVTVDVVRDSASGSCICLPRRELLRTPNGAGTSVYVFRNAYLENQCREIAAALDIRGCVNFEFIEVGDGETPEETWRFLECNPRFSGGVAFSCMAGYDMVKNHLSCFMDRELEPEGEIRSQYIARRYTEYRMKEDIQE